MEESRDQDEPDIAEGCLVFCLFTFRFCVVLSWSRKVESVPADYAGEHAGDKAASR